MKFVALSLPAIPASPEERQQLRPIGHRTDKWQQMIDENVALAQMLDDYGWEAYAFPEHELHTEGFEIGFSTALGMHLLDQTKRLKVGPIGYVLPTWNPVRLAVETAWLDQLSKGRTIVGFAVATSIGGSTCTDKPSGCRWRPVQGMRRINTTAWYSRRSIAS